MCSVSASQTYRMYQAICGRGTKHLDTMWTFSWPIYSAKVYGSEQIYMESSVYDIKLFSVCVTT